MRPPVTLDHPAVTKLKALVRGRHDIPPDVRHGVLDWIEQHIKCCGSESLLYKEAYTKLKGEDLRKLLAAQSKSRELELGRFAVEGAGATEEWDAGYALGRSTRLWVVK